VHAKTDELELLFFLQLVTDGDLLLPLVEEARRRAVPRLKPRLVVDASALSRLPRLGAELEQRGIAFERVTLAEIRARTAPDLEATAAVVTASESSANPHEAARRLVRRARRLGKPTITLQHGFENIGLTWFDQVHQPGNTHFLSDRILTWGSRELLHRDALASTRVRCVPVGCVKELPRARRGLAPPGGRPHLIAIFENLHWHRFDERFRARFLADLEESARAFPDATFFARPHPAGKWLTLRRREPPPDAGNLLVADPDDPRFDAWTAPEILAVADGVITTPSTVALDAARCGKAAAVVGYEQDVAAYAPLTTLRSTADWIGFVRATREAPASEALVKRGREFVRRVTLPGDAAARAIDVVLALIAAPAAARVAARARAAIARLGDALRGPLRPRPRAPAARAARIELPGETLVVISHWDGRPQSDLIELLDQLAREPAGAPFRVRVVVNRSGGERLRMPERHESVEVLERENVGFNLGAWEHGFRIAPRFETYLFLQDECRVRRERWLAPFRKRLADPEVGLLGERLNPPWNRPWEQIEQRFRGHMLKDHFVDGTPAERLAAYRDFFRRHQVPLGEKGDHLQSLVLAARREVLERAGGFLVGRDYGEAIAAEIAISKRVQALGLRIDEVGPEPFFCFDHPQWSARDRARAAAGRTA